MSIEKHLTDLKEALDRNTDALLKAGNTAAPAAETKTTKGAGKAPAAEKITQEQVNAALIKIKDDFGMEEAKGVIKSHGKVEKMSEIKPAQYQAVFDAAIARHAELTEGGGAGDEM